jgi:hypothetical protein
MQVGRVDTRRLVSRRTIRSRSIDDLSEEIDRIVTAAPGHVRSLGNWSPAQVLWHIGKLIELSFDGFLWRYERGPHWLTRALRKITWRGLIWIAFRPGFQNPPEAAVLEPDPALELADAAAYLRGQIARIQRGEQMTQASGVEGPYSHDQWLYIHRLHAELHLSFLGIEES